MTAESWTSVSDVGLAAGTLGLAFLVKSDRVLFARTWMALFITLAAAAAFGALYHGFESLHTDGFWTLTSSTSTASIFIFLMCCICMTKPAWSWLSPLWTLATMIGFIVGGLLSHGPFYYISVTAGVVSLLAAFILKWSPLKRTRNWIWIGLALTVAGLVVQKQASSEGHFNNNVLFHLCQLLANCAFFRAAESAPARIRGTAKG